MSRRSSRNLTTVLKQTKPPNARVAKRVKREIVELPAKLEIVPPELSYIPVLPIEVNDASKVGIDVTLQDAVNHLCRVDSRFQSLFQRFVPKPWTAEGLSEPKNHFRSLVLGIISQQVSSAAARSIGRKFISLFLDHGQLSVNLKVEIDPEVEDGPGVAIKAEPESIEAEAMPPSESVQASAAPAQDSLFQSFFPTPAQVASAEILYLKSAGLSLRKAEYVHGIAQAFVSGELNDDFFATADDETIKKKLVSLRGLGPWSAEMFMMFSLNHWDILSPGDIGIQRGMSYWVGKDPKNKSTHNKNKSQKYMSEAEMAAATALWRPYRSIGCWMMWRIDSPEFNVAKLENVA